MADLLDTTGGGVGTIWIHTPITKIEKSDDGNVIVYGKCTGDDLDLDDQIIDKDFARAALQKWFGSYGNVRQMHSTQLPPGGKAIKLEEKDDGFYLTAKVVEPSAIKLVKEAVYSAYSIGISRPVIVRDPVAKGGRVTGGIVSEVSLVDFPANPTTKFMLADENEDVQKVFDLAKKGGNNLEGNETRGAGTEEDNPAEEEEEGEEEQGKALAADLGKLCDDDACTICAETVEKKELSSKERGNLDNSSFAYIDSKGGRHLPVHDASHVKAALGRFNQTNFESGDAKKTAAKHILRAAKEHGVSVSDDSDVAQAAKVEEASVQKVDGEELLKSAIRLAESGHMDEALTKLRQAVDADLAAEGATPTTTPVLSSIDQGEALELSDSAPGIRKAADPNDAKVDTDVIQLEQDVAQLKDDQAKDDAEEGKARKSFGEYAVGTQHRIRELHDALCPAYESSVVAAAYPQVAKSGPAVAFRPQALALLAKLLGETEDPHLTCAFGDLAGFLGSESAEEVTADVLASIHADLHKAFSEDYPNVRVSPLTLDAGDAGRWNRSFISDDRAALCGSSTHAALPSKDSSTISAGEFDRGELTTGRERPSANKDAEPEIAKRTYYTNAAKEDAREAMAAVHDHLATVFPELCATGPVPGFAPRALSAEWGRIQPSGPVLGFDAPTPSAEHAPAGNGSIRPATLPDAPAMTPPHGEEGPAEEVPAGADVMRSPLMSSADPELTKALDSKIAAVFADLQKQLREPLETISGSIDDLSKRLAELEKQPDPAQAPWRGAVVAMQKLLESGQSVQEEAVSEVDRAGYEARKERVEYLLRVSKGTDPTMREMARTELRKLLG